MFTQVIMNDELLTYLLYIGISSHVAQETNMQ